MPKQSNNPFKNSLVYFKEEFLRDINESVKNGGYILTLKKQEGIYPFKVWPAERNNILAAYALMHKLNDNFESCKSDLNIKDVGMIPYFKGDISSKDLLETLIENKSESNGKVRMFMTILKKDVVLYGCNYDQISKKDSLAVINMDSNPPKIYDFEEISANLQKFNDYLQSGKLENEDLLAMKTVLNNDLPCSKGLFLRKYSA